MEDSDVCFFGVDLNQNFASLCFCSASKPKGPTAHTSLHELFSWDLTSAGTKSIYLPFVIVMAVKNRIVHVICCTKKHLPKDQLQFCKVACKLIVSFFFSYPKYIWVSLDQSKEACKCRCLSLISPRKPCHYRQERKETERWPGVTREGCLPAFPNRKWSVANLEMRTALRGGAFRRAKKTSLAGPRRGLLFHSDFTKVWPLVFFGKND